MLSRVKVRPVGTLPALCARHRAAPPRCMCMRMLHMYMHMHMSCCCAQNVRLHGARADHSHRRKKKTKGLHSKCSKTTEMLDGKHFNVFFQDPPRPLVKARRREWRVVRDPTPTRRTLRSERCPVRA